LLLVAFLLVNAPNCHLSLLLASVVQGDAVNCNTGLGTLNIAKKWLSEISIIQRFLFVAFAGKKQSKTSEKCHKFEKINLEVMTIFYKKIRQNPPILKSRV